jgi:hypothetical protein
MPSNKTSKNTLRRKTQISQLRAESRALRKSLKNENDKVNRLKLENNQFKQSVDKESAAFNDMNNELEKFVIEWGQSMQISDGGINQFTSRFRELCQLADGKKNGL